MARRLVEAKDFLLRQIIDSNNSTREEKKKEIEDRRVNKEYLKRYCTTEINFVTLPRSNVVKTFRFLRSFL